MEERRDLPGSENMPRKRRYHLVKNFFTFWKTAKMYGGENERIDEGVAKMRETLNFFFATQNEVVLLFDGIDLKVDKERIRGRRQDDKYFEDLYDLFLSLCLSQVTFSRAVTDREILLFFRAMAFFPVGREPKKVSYERFKEKIPSEVTHITTVPYDPEESGGAPTLNHFEMARENYRALVDSYDEIAQSVLSGDVIPFRIFDRRVQIFIDLLMEPDCPHLYDYLLLLASLDSFHGREYATHIVNTLMYALATGKMLGASDTLLKRIGTAVLVHGLLRPKMDTTSEETLADFSRSTFLAASRMEYFSLPRIDASLCAAFHPWVFSETETARIRANRRGTVAEEVLTVAKFFEMISRRRASVLAGRKSPSSMFRTLQAILALRREKVFVPVIAEALVAAVGIYPPGQLCAVHNAPHYAFSLSRFPDFSSEGVVCLMDRNGNFVQKTSLRADLLIDMPEIHALRPPPAFLEKVFALFDAPKP